MQSLTRPKLWKSANQTQLRQVPLPVSILGQPTRCRKGLHLAGVVAEDPAALVQVATLGTMATFLLAVIPSVDRKL